MFYVSSCSIDNYYDALVETTDVQTQIFLMQIVKKYLPTVWSKI